MSAANSHLSALTELNLNYVRAVDEADVAWFEANLAADFYNTNADGTFVDRAAFLTEIGRGSSVRDIRQHDAIIRILGDVAIIHAASSSPNATSGVHLPSANGSSNAVIKLTPSAHLTRTAISGRLAFLAPLMVTAPSSRLPPMIRSRSIHALL